MSTRNLEQLFNPRCLVAMTGPALPGSKEKLLLDNLARADSRSRVYVVGGGQSPGGRLIAVDRLEAVPEAIDILLYARPLARIGEIFPAANLDRVANLVLLGFDDPDEPGLLDRVATWARERRVRVLGNNSIGLLLPQRRLNASYHPAMPHPGNIALISQSGALITSILDIARERHIGFSHVVSTGNLLDIDFGDLIDYLGDDDQVDAIALYLENLRQVKKFLSACRQAARQKPIIALKSGRHPRIQKILRRRPSSRQLGSSTAYESAFRRAGIISLGSINELLTAGVTLSSRNIPHGNSFAIITNSDALGLFSVDQLLFRRRQPAPINPRLRRELQNIIPGNPDKNPIYVGATANNKIFADAITAALTAGNFAALIILIVSNGFCRPAEIVATVAAESQRHPVKLFYAWLGGSSFLQHQAREFMRRRIPVYFSLEEALDAYYYSSRYRDKQLKLMAIPPFFDDAQPVHKARARQLLAPKLSDQPTRPPAAITRELLHIYGLPVREDNPGGGGKTLQLRLGSNLDPEFGPVISLGLAGPCARFNPEQATMLPPLNPLLNRHLLESSPAGPQLHRYSLTRLHEVMLRFSTLLEDFAEIRHLELHLQVAEDGTVTIAAAAMEVQAASVTAPHHLVIMPYPGQYRSEVRLDDGTRILIRPIKPEDEEKHFAFFHSLSRQTNYYRFFSYRKQLTREQITRFTQIDYDREMAIIALVRENGREKTIGVNRMVYYPHRDRYEFALVVTDAWQGRGVGKILMEKLLAIARDRGLKTIYGQVLAENSRMLRFCRRFGFREVDSEGDVVLLRLELESETAAAGSDDKNA